MSHQEMLIHTLWLLPSSVVKPPMKVILITIARMIYTVPAMCHSGYTTTWCTTLAPSSAVYLALTLCISSEVLSPDLYTRNCPFSLHISSSDGVGVARSQRRNGCGCHAGIPSHPHGSLSSTAHTTVNVRPL